jgi:hypothetical protein
MRKCANGCDVPRRAPSDLCVACTLGIGRELRFDGSAARDVAIALVEGDAGRIWFCVGAPIRSALIDAGIMAHVRAVRGAWSDDDADKPFTAGDLIAFRDRVVKVLAAGVARRGRMKVALKVEE